jgi:hypothetical protein
MTAGARGTQLCIFCLRIDPSFVELLSLILPTLILLAPSVARPLELSLVFIPLSLECLGLLCTCLFSFSISLLLLKFSIRNSCFLLHVQSEHPYG